jgi:hypothetical protein
MEVTVVGNDCLGEIVIGRYKNYTNGEWIDAVAGESFENRNQSDVKEIIRLLFWGRIRIWIEQKLHPGICFYSLKCIFFIK